jgi:hypothetical protein
MELNFASKLLDQLLGLLEAPRVLNLISEVTGIENVKILIF